MWGGAGDPGDPRDLRRRRRYPNNSEAERLGRKQSADGIEEMEKALAGKKRSELTGKLEVFRPCFDEASEKATLKEELRVYEYCPRDGELYKDFVIP